MRFPRPLLAPVALGILAACGTAVDSSAPPTLPDAPAAAEAVAKYTPTVVHRHEVLGVPTFTWIRGPAGVPFSTASKTTAEQIAWATVTRAGETLGLGREALAAASMTEVDTHGTGLIVARFAQKIAGIDVFRAQLDVAMTRDREPVAITGYLGPAVKPRAGHSEFRMRASACAGAALRAVTGRPAEDRAFALHEEDGAGYGRYVSGDAKARVKKVWFPRANGLDAAYYVELDVEHSGRPDADARAFVIDANDESILFEKNLVAADSYTYRVFADSSGKRQPYDSHFGNATAPHPTGTPNRVQFPFAASNLVSLESSPFSKNDPWLPPNALGTRGNNVDAYSDLVAPDGFNAGDLRPTATAKTFDFTYNTTKNAGADNTQRNAATVQLFYTLNFLHDWFYDAGFDEKSGNHQTDNFGRGGLGNDAIRGELQDYAGFNNANARTPADGEPARLQMFVFWGIDTFLAQVTAPAGVGDLGEVSGPDFGPPGSHDFSHTVVLANDGAGASTSDACESLVNEVAGKIVLVELGACSVKKQVLNAQTAGATGVLVTGAPPPNLPMLANDAAITTAITIPSLGIAKPKGDAIKAALGGGPVTLRMKKQYRGLDRDPSFDTSLLVHEWGHTMNNRLVHNVTGLNGPQADALDEGLADFVALLTTVRAEDALLAINSNWSGTYPVGNYVGSGGETNGIYFGLRRYPYSTDLAKNPLTFKHIQDGATLPADIPFNQRTSGATMSNVHNAGEVFAVMLWECYAALLRNSARLTFDEAQTRMKRYLVGALKLTPPAPTYLEVRDAFLAAAAAGDEKDFALFVTAFAKRGAGAGAVAPERTAVGNPGVIESFETTGTTIELVSSSLVDDVESCDRDGVLDDGETGKLVVTIKNIGFSDLTSATATVTSDVAGLTIANGGKLAFAAAKPFQTVTASVNVSMTAPAVVLPYTLTIALTDPQLATPQAITGKHRGSGNFDEKAESATTDRVDTKRSAWTTSSAPSSAGTGFQRLANSEGEGYWHIDDTVGIADHWLVSPPLEVSATDELTLAFKTRWRFESRAMDNEYYDGAVVEISADNGATWTDVGAHFTPGYGGAIVGDRESPIKGRQAFVGQSPDYPAMIQATASFGTTYAGKTVKLRFRFASDREWGSTGWDIDDLTFTGIANTPFTARVPDATRCVPGPGGPSAPDPGGPSAPPAASPGADAGAASSPESVSADGGCNVGTTGAPLRGGLLSGLGALLALGVARRRRQGRR